MSETLYLYTRGAGILREAVKPPDELASRFGELDKSCHRTHDCECLQPFMLSLALMRKTILPDRR